VPFKYLSKLIILLILSSQNLWGEELNLKRLTKLVLSNNFDIKIANARSMEKEGSYIKSGGDFDLGLNYAFTYTDSDTPSSSSLDGGGSAVSVKSSALAQSLTLSKTFGSGTEISLPYTWDVNESTSSFKIFKKSHEPSIAINLTQPIIRSFTRDYFTKSLDSSESDWLIERAKSEAKIEDTLKLALEKYFDVIENEKAHEISLNSLITSRDNFDFVKQKRKVGRSGLIEQLDAESSYKKAIERELKSKNKYQKLKGELGIIVYADSEKEFRFSKLNIDDFKIELPHENDLIKLIASAVENRKETFSKKMAYEKAMNIARLSKTDLFPTVDLDLGYESNGLSDTYSKANSEIFKRKFITSRVGVTVARDLFQYGAKGSLKTNELKALQEDLKYRQHLQNIGLEIRSVLAELKSQVAVIDAMQASVKAESLKFKYRLKQFKQGKLSSFELAKQQESKEKSDLELAKAEMSYLKKVFSLYHAKGELTKNLLK
jgi:outer membrane protein TolC